MKNSKTKSVLQQQMFVTIPVKEVEKLRQLTVVFSKSLIKGGIKSNL